MELLIFVEWLNGCLFFFKLTWLSSIKDLNVIRIDTYPNHRFLSFVLRSGLDIFIKRIVYVFVCVHECACGYRLCVWILKIHLYLWLKPNCAVLTHSDRKGSFQIHVTTSKRWGEQHRPGYISLSTHKQELGKKKCWWTEAFLRRGFTHAFLIRIIFHRDLSPLTSAAGRSFLKCISSRSQPWTSFSLYKSGHRVLLFLQGKKNNPLEFHRTLMPTAFISNNCCHLEPSPVPPVYLANSLDIWL